jgi:type VI protein secretion system component VasK
MPSQEVINLIITGAGTIFGWLLKSMWEAVRDLKNDMREIESEVHRDYVRKDEFRADLDEIKSILKEIFADLKKKADK